MSKWDNGVYKSDAMADVPGITAGCGTYTKDGSWTCTEHINWSGLELHVGDQGVLKGLTPVRDE